MGLVMIDITKITLVLCTGMTNGRDYLDMLKVYNGIFELIKSNTCVELHM